MPELPEVETVRRALEMHATGAKINAVSGSPVRLRRPLDVDCLAGVLPGQRLEAPRRRGKFLLLDCDGGGSLLVHLGMSGRVQLVDGDPPRADHTHLELILDDGRRLRYVDPRRFGLITWLAAGAQGRDPSLDRLGIEPLDPELPARLPSLFRHRRAPVKSLLLDQRLVAGVGNIYAVEALWRARIRPTRPGGAISKARLQRLAEEVATVLEEAIAAGGTTLRDFASPSGSEGYFAIELKAYGRHGKPCLACGSVMRRSVIGGRATAWCGRCQR